MEGSVLQSMDPNTSDTFGVILYGDGAAGNFQAQANNLAAHDLSKRFRKEDIVVRQTLTRDSFFQALLSVPNGKILELDIFATSVGAGLCLGYRDPTAAQNRERLMNLSTASGTAANVFDGGAGATSYGAVLTAETGSLLTDHLVAAPFNQNQADLRAKFAPGAKARLYGCNGGVAGWVYSDQPSQIGGRSGVGEPYYWRALNTRNTPKPSIAKALADFFGIPVTATASLAPVEKFQESQADPHPRNEAPILRSAIQHKSIVEIVPNETNLGGRSSTYPTAQPVVHPSARPTLHPVLRGEAHRK